LTVKVFESFEDAQILAHGVSISPGKPTIIAKVGSQALFGLPGHVASALVVAEVFLGPFLARLAGEKTLVSRLYDVIEAELGRNVESASGREDYIRVSLKRKGDGYLAEPIFGKSGLISTLVEADGLLRVEMNTEGLYKGQRVAIMAFRPLKGDILET
jgi:molybdopterin molybdotransferase